jgi:hypothetical protein
MKGPGGFDSHILPLTLPETLTVFVAPLNSIRGEGEINIIKTNL